MEDIIKDYPDDGGKAFLGKTSLESIILIGCGNVVVLVLLLFVLRPSSVDGSKPISDHISSVLEKSIGSSSSSSSSSAIKRSGISRSNTGRTNKTKKN